MLNVKKKHYYNFP